MADQTVTLTHPDADKPLTVPADEADKYTHGGWSEQTTADDKKSTNK